MVHISAQIEINGSPEKVREVLLDFGHWPEWLTIGLSMTVASPNHKLGLELQHGDRLRSDFKGTVVKPKVLENTPINFEWRGRFGIILLVGHRRFFLKKSETIPGGTTLMQNEDIKGLLAFLFKKNEGHGKDAREAMTKFTEQLKARVESL
ncbi:hypothetical protein F5144DRAFT_609114 [Chaetomium tenue]|uniref:Uncharacterized protein n=1 Tax=Chaetomium tenue TaxID=1854479 RepID=A0ACB7PR61_9PEZI|nr:hypothetical protein F5144DRAFT_609114 [Chaetomium globosum]